MLWHLMLHGWGQQHASQKYELQESPHCQACISTAWYNEERLQLQSKYNIVHIMIPLLTVFNYHTQHWPVLAIRLQQVFLLFRASKPMLLYSSCQIKNKREREASIRKRIIYSYVIIQITSSKWNQAASYTDKAIIKCKVSLEKYNLGKSFPFIFCQGFCVSLKTCLGNTYLKSLFFSFLLCLRLQKNYMVVKASIRNLYQVNERREKWTV